MKWCKVLAEDCSDEGTTKVGADLLNGTWARHVIKRFGRHFDAKVVTRPLERNTAARTAIR